MDAFVDFLINGFSHWSGWIIFIYTVVVTHITIASITIFLHRCQAHRALELHPIPSHFFRFWLWLTTGTITKEWAAIHRKHHAKCETDEDPHSPQTRGIRKVLFEGAELYRLEAKNLETIQKYGKGTPDDWMERNLYTPHSVKGVAIMLIIDVLLFGMIGVIVWAIQMLWQPVTAAGIINGIGHYWGYRNFDSPDASTNIIPVGILIGGEELHNNHHTYGSSAKLSVKWYEFDIGWGYIRGLEILGLATVKKLPPKMKLGNFNPTVTAETIKTLANHRYEIMANFTKQMKHAYVNKVSNVENNPEYLKFITMRDELYQFWSSKASTDQLVVDFKSWCIKAEGSQIQFLSNLSIYLRSMKTST
jgi:stearoyl-CoA desaturase (delta-9 desaturase)